MKKFYFSLFALIFGFHTMGQNAPEQAGILQLCLDLPELQDFYPQDEDGIYIEPYIMQYPIAFPTDIDVSKFGKRPVFMSRHEMYDNNIEAFFLFKKMEITSETATVEFSMYYDYNSPEQKYSHIVLNVVKDSGVWKIINTQIESA